MSQNEEPKEDLQDASKREALAKLAKMTAYSTPAVVTLLTPQLSHAAASIPAGPGNGCFARGRHFLTPGANSGGDSGSDPLTFLGGDQPLFSGDTSADCGE